MPKQRPDRALQCHLPDVHTHCVCHCCSRTFFISSPHWCVTIEIRPWWQRCQRGVGGKGGLKLNGKLCTSIKTCGEDIKSYTPVPGDRMQEGGDAMQRDSSIRIPGFLAVPQGEKRRRRERETGQLGLIMYLELVYRNAHEMCKIHGAIHSFRMNQGQNQMVTRGQSSGNAGMSLCYNGRRLQLQCAGTKQNIQQKYSVVIMWFKYQWSSYRQGAGWHTIILQRLWKKARQCSQSVQGTTSLRLTCAECAPVNSANHEGPMI